MSVDNKEKYEWLSHCCDKELITSSNIADNAMRLQMVTHPNNFRSQCCSYMDVFYKFTLYVYCVRAWILEYWVVQPLHCYLHDTKHK